MGLRLRSAAIDLKIGRILGPLFAELGFIETRVCEDGEVVMLDVDSVSLTREQVGLVVRHLYACEPPLTYSTIGSVNRKAWACTVDALQAWLETDEQIAVFC